MKVIILAAGEGKRLRPYTQDRPKCMVEIEGVTLIDRQIEVLKSVGLNDILIIGGYKADMLKRTDTKLKINPRYQETNMVWTLFCAEEELSGDVVISYGDIVYSKEILQKLISSDSDISITIDKDWENYWSARSENPLADAETLKLSDDGLVFEIGKKPQSINEIDGQYMGLMKFSSHGIKQLKSVFHMALKTGELGGKALASSYMTDLLQSAINTGYSVQSVPVFGGWVEIDTVEDLESPITKDRINSIK